MPEHRAPLEAPPDVQQRELADSICAGRE